MQRRPDLQLHFATFPSGVLAITLSTSKSTFVENVSETTAHVRRRRRLTSAAAIVVSSAFVSYAGATCGGVSLRWRDARSAPQRCQPRRCEGRPDRGESCEARVLTTRLTGDAVASALSCLCAPRSSAAYQSQECPLRERTRDRCWGRARNRKMRVYGILRGHMCTCLSICERFSREKWRGAQRGSAHQSKGTRDHLQQPPLFS